MSPHTRLLDIVTGFGLAHAVFVAAELRLADLIFDGVITSEDLAQRTDMHLHSLRRILRTLVAAGLCVEQDNGSYALTPAGEVLRSDVPGSLRAWVRLMIGEESRNAWGHLLHNVRTGKTAFDTVFGTDVWTYRSRHAESAEVFSDAMAHLSHLYYSAVIGAYPFSQFRKVVDVGGGTGNFIISLLHASAHTSAVLFDVPRVAEKARQRIASAGVAGRCEIVGGDAFVAVPEGGDAYVLCRVIHDWDDERAVTLLINCRRAMSNSGTLLLVESVLPDTMRCGASEERVSVQDLRMMVMNGGGERTQAEYRSLYERAGFALTRFVPTEWGMHVIEGVPA